MEASYTIKLSYRWNCPSCGNEYIEDELVPQVHCPVCDQSLELTSHPTPSKPEPAVLICLMGEETSLADLCPGLTESQAAESLWEFLLSSRVNITPEVPVISTRIASPLELDACLDVVDKLLNHDPKVVVGAWPMQLLEALGEFFMDYLSDPRPTDFPIVVAPVWGRDQEGRNRFVRWARVI